MLERWMMALGFGLCHQLPERSFFGGGVQVPVCARDTGIYVGFALGLIALRLIDRRRRSSEPPPAFAVAALVAMLALMALDGVTSYAGLRQTTNEIRLFTGLGAGLAIAGLTYPMLNGQLWRQPGSSRALGTVGQLALYVAALPVSYALTSWMFPYLGLVYPLLVTVAILVTFTAVNLVIVCLLPAFERRFERLREAWLPVLLAVGLSLVELWLAAVIRVAMLRAAGLA